MTSPGSSTTQMMPASRRSSWQMRQQASSARLKQISQGRIFSLTSRMAAGSAVASSGATRRWGNASRCAVRWPMPGSLPSSVTRRWTGGANNRRLPVLLRRGAARRAVHPRGRAAGARAAARRAEATEGVAQAEALERLHRIEAAGPRRGLHRLLLQLDGLAQRLVGRGQDEVLEHLDVLGIDGVGVDRQRVHPEVAGDDDLDHAAAGRGLDLLLLEGLLGLLLGGHDLLGLLEHLLDV